MFGNEFGITTSFVAIANVGHGGERNRSKTSHKVIYGSNNVVKENHPQASSTIQAGFWIQEINLGPFDRHYWCILFILSSIYVGWYLVYCVAFKLVQNVETLCARHNNCYFAQCKFKYSTFQNERKSPSFGDQSMHVSNVGTNSFHEHWGPWPIPKLTPFTYWNQKWEMIF